MTRVVDLIRAVLGACGEYRERLRALLPCLLVLCTLAPTAHAADDGITDSLTLPAGSYIVDTGSPSPTVANALKPYGLVYELVRNQKVPVWWVINPGKAKDGVDFTDPGTGKGYRAGPFAISADYVTPAVASVIAQWKALGVLVDGPTAAPIAGVPVYQPITGLANTALDLKNGGIAAGYFSAAGIPSTAFALKSPDALSPCDDLFTLPHADPTWGTHKYLLDYVKNKGFLWAGCHAVSVLENLDDPSTPTVNPDMNFLSTTGLVPFGDHGNGSPPYTAAMPSDPVMQFIGSTDAAQQGGSEQIYLPKNAGGWRPGTRLLVTDPTHADVPGVSPGPAAAMVYGHAFDNTRYGKVMYEGGHNVGGSTPSAIAAQRSYLNFWLLAQLNRSPGVKAGTAVTISALNEGATTTFNASLNHFAGVTVQWTSSGGGVFSSPNGMSTTFTAPEVGTDTPIMIRVTVTDACGRVAYDAYPLTVKNVAKADLAIAKAASQNPIAAGTAFSYTLAVSNLGTDAASSVLVEDVLPAGLGYVGASGSGWICSFDAGTRKLACTRPTLALTGGTPSAITVNVTAPASPGALLNTATVTAATPDANPANNSASVTVNVASGVDLALTKTAPAGPLYAGAPVSYALAVSNNSALAATSVTVDDVLDAALAFVAAGGNGWNCVYQSSDRRLTCFTATLAAGATSTISLTVTPAGSAGTMIANRATVSSPDFRDTVPANDTSSTSITLSAPADLAVSASGSTTGGGGSQVDTHVVTLTNNGPGTALGIVVSDVMSGTGLSKYASGCTVVASAGTLGTASPWSNAMLVAGSTWNLASLASGASATLTLTCTGDNNNSVTNTATVTSTSYDPNSANDSASAYVVDGTVKTIDLSLAKTASTPSALVGDTLTYTLAVTNLSTTDDARNGITIVDTLPAGVSFLSAADRIGSWSCSASGATVTCSTGSDAKKVGTSPNTLSVDLLVRLPATAGMLTNTASMSTAPSSGVYDPPANNSASVATTLLYPTTDIAVAKSVNTATPALGGNVIFTVTVSNPGPNAATNLRLLDALPGELALVSTSATQGSYDPATGLWYVGTLASGASARLTVTATTSQTGVSTNQACLYALDQTDSNSANNCASVSVTPQQADLRLTQTVDNATPGVGTQATFTVTLNNLGGSAASAITVLDALPEGLQFVSASASAGSYDAASGRWTIAGPLASGASATLTLVAKVTLAATPLVNAASITASSAPDPVLSNNAASASVTGQAADIELTKSVDVTTPLVLNTPLTFTVTTTNRGPTGASSISISDLLPAGLAYQSSSPSQGSYDPATGLWSVGALANGASATLRVVATNTSFGLLTNTASKIATVPPDPGTTNDTASVQILSGGAADLALTKSVDKPATFQGDTVSFTLQLDNSGPNPATGVAVKDLLPAGLGYVGSVASQGSYTPASGLWSVGTVAVGQRVTLTLRALVSASGSLINSASIQSLDQADADPSDNSATAGMFAAPAADLAVTIGGTTAAAVGAAVNYTLVASNHGPAAVTDATLAATVPPSIAVASWTCVAAGDADCDTSSAGSGAAGSGNALSLPHLRIAAGAGNYVSVTFAGSAASATTATTTAILSPPTAGSVFDTNIGNNSASVTTVISNSRITGSVFADTGAGATANDGLQGGSEGGIAQVTVRLTDCGSTVHGSTTTDGAGLFTLAIPSNLAVGTTLCVAQTNLAGYLSTGGRPGNSGGSYDRASDGVRFTLAANVAYGGLAFGDVPENRLLTDGAKTALPGSTLSYAHTFVAGSGGQVTFGVMAAASPAASGWNQQLFRDNDCDGVLATPSDTPITAALPVAARERVCLILQQFVPAGLPAGATSLATLQAFFVYTGATPALSASASRQDLTTVGLSALQLGKEVRNVTQNGAWGTSNAARPGDVLEYRLSYTNLGVEPIQGLVLRDMTPAYTSYVSGACTLPLPAGLSLCTLSAPAVGATGGVVWNFSGNLASALSGSVSYRVKVD